MLLAQVEEWNVDSRCNLTHHAALLCVSRSVRAGTPATVAPAGTSRITTAPAPIAPARRLSRRKGHVRRSLSMERPSCVEIRRQVSDDSTGIGLTAVSLSRSQFGCTCRRLPCIRGRRAARRHWSSHRRWLRETRRRSPRRHLSAGLSKSTKASRDSGCSTEREKPSAPWRRTTNRSKPARGITSRSPTTAAGRRMVTRST